MNDNAPRRSCSLDTNVFISAFETTSGDSTPLLALFAHFKAVLGSAVTSELMLAEPLAATSERHVMKVEARKSLFMDLLVRGGFIDPRPVTLAILVESATVPRDTDGKHSRPDAIHIATATAAGRALFVTHDRRIRAVPPAITIVRPDASGVAAILDGSRV